MAYYFATVLDQGVDQTVALVTEALKSEGFGVLTTIDVQATLKSKLGVDFPEYRILGACNPMLAHEALQIEDKVGTMLPATWSCTPSATVERKWPRSTRWPRCKRFRTSS